LIPVALRYIWAKELSEAAEDVVEVTDGNSTEEGPRDNGDVEIVVHDRSQSGGTGKDAGGGDDWSRLSNGHAITLPSQQDELARGFEEHGDVSIAAKSKAKGWMSNPFAGRSEGKIRL